MLSLPEELYLLAFDEDKGAVIKSAKQALTFALVGAIISDLVLHNKIVVNDKSRIEVVDKIGTGDQLLDTVLSKIQGSEKPRRVSYWISELVKKPKKLHLGIEESLVNKAIILREDDRYVGITPPGSNSSFGGKYAIKVQLRDGILAGQPNDLHDLALLGIVRASQLLNLVFTTDELRLARKRIQEAIVREALGNPTAQTIEEINSAIFSCLSEF